MGVWDNSELTTLGDFPALTSIGTGSTNRGRSNVSIQVEDNSSLSDCYTLTDFLPGGTHAVSGGIYINDNAGVCTDQSALSNTIYRGDIIVTTQAAVDALGVSGGALAGNITKIIGNVVIKGPVTNLSVFNAIDTITGY